MNIKKVKGFFALGFGIERLMLSDRQGRALTYQGKMFFGCYVWNFTIHTKAYNEYVKTVSYGIRNNTTGGSAK